jgi:hypothetical protein
LEIPTNLVAFVFKVFGISILKSSYPFFYGDKVLVANPKNTWTYDQF